MNARHERGGAAEKSGEDGGMTRHVDALEQHSSSSCASVGVSAARRGISAVRITLVAYLMHNLKSTLKITYKVDVAQIMALVFSMLHTQLNISFLHCPAIYASGN